jgi:hypothetical protein
MPSLKDHSSCSTSASIANSVDPATYTAGHREGSCTTRGYAAADLQNVMAILSAGEISVMNFDLSRNPAVTVATASNIPYVAISQVWADGIGNTTEPGLPKCQLQRISSMTGKLMSEGTFWLDSLCVPELCTMRKKANGLMGETCRKAAKVLVIDSGIRSCSKNVPLEQKLRRVLTSGWMQRPWTLQKTVLAKELVFEFDGGLVTSMDLLPQGYLVTTIQAYLVRDTSE